MNVVLLRDTAVDRFFQDETSRIKWNKLYETCEWATSMQSLPFVETWYQVYRKVYEPLLIVGTDDKGNLVGIFSLAVERATNRLAFAGEHFAEYKTWIAADTARDSFIERAFDALCRIFPNQSLQFLFLAPKSPLGWLSNESNWSRKSELRKMPRPLMNIEDNLDLEESLRKKGNRSRIKQLERLGKLSFTQLTDHTQLDAVFDEIETNGNLRLSAVHNVQTARDPYKRAFYVELMKTGMIHATLLKVGDEIASAHINLCNRNEVALGITSLSPFYARYSPSKFHIIFLGLELAKQGLKAFDLTPGGEYKDRHATHYDDAYALTVFFGKTGYLRYKTKRTFIALAKRGLETLHIKRDELVAGVGKVRQTFRKIKSTGITDLLNRRTELRVYSINPDQVASFPKPRLMKHNCVKDLLAYAPTEPRQQTISEFHSSALKKFEEGFTAFTRVEGGQLLYYGWLAEKQVKLFLNVVDQYAYTPPEAAIIYDCYISPAVRNKHSYRDLVYQMVHEAARFPNTKQIYIFVPSDDKTLRSAIENIGFEYQYSHFKEEKFGKSNIWSSARKDQQFELTQNAASTK